MLKYLLSIVSLFVMVAPAYNLDMKVPSGIVTTVTSKFFKDYRESILTLFEAQMKEMRMADSTQRMDAGLATLALLI